jgi:hypothetical protein
VREQAFVLVLRKDKRIGVRTDARAHIPQHETRDLPTRDPEVRCRDFTTARDDDIREPDLPVELERARLNRDRARRCGRLRRLIDNAHLHTKPPEPERQDQTSRARADDQFLR